jgi:hypothetical protein
VGSGLGLGILNLTIAWAGLARLGLISFWPLDAGQPKPLRT